MARWFMLVGALLLFTGAALQYAPWLVNWFGRLPGDLRFESGGTRIFVPITSMIIVSVVLTILINVLRR